MSVDKELEARRNDGDALAPIGREPFGRWARRNPLKLAVAGAGIVLAFLPSMSGMPLYIYFSVNDTPPPRDALVRVVTDPSVCWSVTLGLHGRPIRDCGTRTFDIFPEEDVIEDLEGEYIAEVTKEYEDEVNDEPVRIVLEIDGEIVDRDVTTLGTASVSSID